MKWLLIANAVVFVLYFLSFGTALQAVFNPLRLYPSQVLGSLAVWQLATYLFLHSGIGHLFFNMLGLWMFGAQLENTWGTRRFLQYYFICGVGAGICVVIAGLLAGARDQYTIGASGAVFGILLAFGVLFPNQLIWIWFLFPVKAKYFVLALGAINFLYMIKLPGSGVSYVAHLGGMLFGYLFLRRRFQRIDLLGAVRRWLEQWRVRRARRRFEVYLRKRDSNRDPWVH